MLLKAQIQAILAVGVGKANKVIDDESVQNTGITGN